MPRKRARAKHPRVKLTAKIALARIVDGAANVEAPLAETRDFLHVLLVMGCGMIAEHEDNGRPIVAAVEAAWQRLDAVRDAWTEVIESARRQTAAR